MNFDPSDQTVTKKNGINFIFRGPMKKDVRYSINFVFSFRNLHPDFLPNPIPFLRDRILEKLERKDMFRRRQQIDIPEFYVG